LVCRRRFLHESALTFVHFDNYRLAMFPAEKNPQSDRILYQLRSSGIKPEQMEALRSGAHTRGYLPHVKREGARYFVTFRLIDSLPKDVVIRIQQERSERLLALNAQYPSSASGAKANRNVSAANPNITTVSRNGAPASDSSRKAIRTNSGHNASGTTQDSRPEDFWNELQEIERDYHRKMERYLDSHLGRCWLKQPEIAALVASSLRFFENKRYYLEAWCVMPNHVHVVLWPMANETLSGILKSWKRYTAREANKILNRTGNNFWQPESFDHWIRNDEEHSRCCGYVIRNPVKAGLCKAPQEWRWSSAYKASDGSIP
jgi:putative transposase